MSNHDDEVTTRDAAAQAQLLYVAYYGRPGDPGGLDFWTNEFMNSDHVDSAVAAFGASDEFTMLSADMDHGMLVDLLYMQMFNRAPDDAGKEYYVGQLESGEATLASIALDIANGATGRRHDHAAQQGRGGQHLHRGGARSRCRLRRFPHLSCSGGSGCRG